MRKPNRICVDCSKRPAMVLSSYCAECKSARNKAWQLAHPGHRRRSDQRKADPNVCNCGNPACNGLTCERVSV